MYIVYVYLFLAIAFKSHKTLLVIIHFTVIVHHIRRFYEII